MQLVIGEMVKNPYRSFHTARPPGDKRVHIGKGSRVWQRWDRERMEVEKGSICVVIETVDLDGHQWACVLVDGRTGWTASVSLSRIGPRGGWKR